MGLFYLFCGLLAFTLTVMGFISFTIYLATYEGSKIKCIKDMIGTFLKIIKEFFLLIYGITIIIFQGLKSLYDETDMKQIGKYLFVFSVIAFMLVTVMVLSSPEKDTNPFTYLLLLTNVFLVGGMFTMMHFEDLEYFFAIIIFVILLIIVGGIGHKYTDKNHPQCSQTQSYLK